MSSKVIVVIRTSMSGSAVEGGKLRPRHHREWGNDRLFGDNTCFDAAFNTTGTVGTAGGNDRLDGGEDGNATSGRHAMTSSTATPQR
jgi:hypothetical protein